MILFVIVLISLGLVNIFVCHIASKNAVEEKW